MSSHADADILMKLYDLRREEKMRKARVFITSKYTAENLQDHLSKYPPPSEESALFRQAVTYWEMAASMVNSAALDEKLFFENASEHFVTWEKVKHVIPEMRKAYKNPFLYHNLEAVAGRYERWVTNRAPEAIAAMRERFGIKR